MAPRGGRGRSTNPEVAVPGSEQARVAGWAQYVVVGLGIQPVRSTVAALVVSHKPGVPGKSLSHVETHRGQPQEQLEAKFLASMEKAPLYRATLVGCLTAQTGEGMCNVVLQAGDTHNLVLRMAGAASRSWARASTPDGV